MRVTVTAAKRKGVKAEVFKGPFDPGGQPSLEQDHPLHLSLFAWNVRSGLSATKAVLADPARHRDFWEWPSASRLLRAAERAGFDSQLQYGMWSGYGGTTGWNDSSLDFATGAAASAAVTERLGLFTTVHVGYRFHPLLIAKITAATDFISGGRLGVNLVAAADAHDYAQFGFDQAMSTPDRYAEVDEFTTLLKYLWTSEEPVDFEGERFQAYGAQVQPRPASSPRPLLMSAAGSDAGIDFAARQCDAIFVTDVSGSQAGFARKAEQVHSAAARHGRKVRICAMCYVVMEDTDAKAAETARWLEDEIDFDALATYSGRVGWARDRREAAPADDPYLGLGEELYKRLGVGMIGYQLIGSYATVAERLAGLYEAGIEHVALCFFDPHRGVEQVGEHLMPLLRKRGLRRG
jgi:dimethylsulfone monooxygenase